MNSKTLHEWATELSAGRGHSPAEWETAIQRAIKRGTLSFFIESTSPRIPCILDTDIRDWLELRSGESELVDAPPLPSNRAPKSFRTPPSPGTGHHGSRLTIGMRL